MLKATTEALSSFAEIRFARQQCRGLPQNRERVFIVGHRRGTSKPEVFPFEGEVANACQVVGRLEGINGHDYLKRVYASDGLSPTLATCTGGNHEGKFLFPDGRIRRLTPVERERLQGFPDDWTAGVSDAQRTKCLGNAVTVNVIRDIAVRLLSPHLLLIDFGQGTVEIETQN